MSTASRTNDNNLNIVLQKEKFYGRYLSKHLHLFSNFTKF